MSASLVGSEMCIRDRLGSRAPVRGLNRGLSGGFPWQVLVASAHRGEGCEPPWKRLDRIDHLPNRNMQTRLGRTGIPRSSLLERVIQPSWLWRGPEDSIIMTLEGSGGVRLFRKVAEGAGSESGGAFAPAHCADAQALGESPEPAPMHCADAQALGTGAAPDSPRDRRRCPMP
eukprot:1892581-Alexandrium_andersonii.AAC.2